MTATLPETFFEDKPLQKGSRCEIEIVSVGRAGVLVRYVTHEGQDEEETPSPRQMVDQSVAENGENY